MEIEAGREVPCSLGNPSSSSDFAMPGQKLLSQGYQSAWHVEN